MSVLRNQKPGFRNLACVVLILFEGACSVARAPYLSSDENLPRGAWQAESQARQISFEPDRIVIAEGQRIKAMKVLERQPEALVVRNEGLRETWRLSRDNEGGVRFGHGTDVVRYRPLHGVPPELNLGPIPIGNPGQLTQEEIEAIQEEIIRRRDLDQAVRKDPALKEKWEETTADNSRYIRSLIQRVGWISSEKFGNRASAAAALLAKHGSDPRVMQAILPFVQDDVKRKAVSAELYSVLFDELRLTLGEKQRYGTQIFKDDEGQPYVLPLEAPDKVEELRKEIGLEPLADYLATASKYLYDGQPIRMPRSDE